MKVRRGKLSAVVLTGIAVLLLIFGLVADFIGYRQFTRSFTAQYQDTAIAIANEATTLIRVSELDEYLETKCGSPASLRAREEVQTLCDKMNAELIYIMFVSDKPDRAYGQFQVVLTVKHTGSTAPLYDIGFVRDTTNDEYCESYRKLYEGESDAEIVVRDKGVIETGSHITALVPLKDADGKTVALLAVQKQMDYLEQARTRYLNSIVIASVLIIVAAGTGWFFFLRARLLQPLARISREARRFADENTLREEPLASKIRYRDELGSLAALIDEMEVKTLDNFATIGKITADKQRVDAELNLATEIQANMLPRSFPPFADHDEFDLFATMDPAREVGGDFYDFFLVDDRHVAVVMADVSGKGVPAALYMMITKTLIKIHSQLGLSPADAFTKVNHLICENNDAGLFITAWMGLLDLDTGKMTYVNAGHNPPLLLRAGGSFSYLKSRPGFVLAGMDGVVYRETEITLAPGDRLFLYTDGVTEATDTKKELYGEDRLAAYLNAHKTDGLRELLGGLRADIDAFTGEAEQFDDMTMLILDYLKGGENHD